MLDVTKPVHVVVEPGVEHTSTTRDSTIKRGHTISGVTAEAGAVFEHLLRRSHSDSSSSNSRRGQRRVARRPLTVIAETSYSAGVGRHIDESTDNWTTDVTRDSTDTRLSSYNRLDEVDGRPSLDEVDGRPSRSSVQTGDGYHHQSRDSTDIFDSRHSTGTRLSSNDALDDVRLGSTQSNSYSQQFSRDSSDLLAPSGVNHRQTAGAPSLASMSGDLADYDSDADDERRRQEKTSKKKKSVFQRVRERLRATFSRDEDRNKAAHKAEKYMHANGKAGRQNWLTASFRRRRNKQQTDHGDQNGSTSATSHPRSYDDLNSESHSRYTVDRQPADHDQHKSKSFLSSLQRRFTTIRVKRTQSHGSVSSGTSLSRSADETNIHPLSESQQIILSRYATQEPLPTVSTSMHSRPGHHSIRATLELAIAQPMRPATDGVPTDAEAVVVDVDPTRSSELENRSMDWDFIDGDERQGEPLQHATTRRFSQKSPAEKEELYERIASQLISIGDTYVISTTPHGDESAECAASLSALGSTREMSVDLSAVARQMLSTATHSYDTFQSVVSDAIHGESGLQQIASMFQLCRAAIEHAGTGTELAVSIKNMAMQYFEQYFAPWVVEQGGWESVADSGDSELD